MARPWPEDLSLDFEAFRDNGGTPLAYFSRFKADGKLSNVDAGVEEMGRSCRALQSMVCYDQLNAPNISAADLLARNIQMCAELYRERFTGPKEGSEERHLMLGTDQVRGNLPICPALQDWIAEELREESSVLKERRKAREERALLRPSGKDDKPKK